jgi:hypothetical protein
VAFSDRSHGRKISAVHVLTDESTLNRGAWLGTHAYRYDVRAGRVQVTPATVSWYGDDRIPAAARNHPVM